jgi:hypothetical protein
VPRAGLGPGPGRTSSDRADARTRGEDLRPGRRRQDHPQDRRHGGPAGPGDHPPLDRRERGVPPRYALAKEGLVEDILEEINEIADDATKDYGLEEGTDGTPVVREKKETIARATLRIATKFKLIGKVAPPQIRRRSARMASPAAPEQPREGAGAKVMDGEVIPIEQHLCSTRRPGARWRRKRNEAWPGNFAALAI